MYLSPEKRPKISMEIHIMNTREYLASFQFKTSVFFKTFTLFRYHIIVISSVLLLLFAFVFLFCIIYDPRGKIIDYH